MILSALYFISFVSVVYYTYMYVLSVTFIEHATYNCEHVYADFQHTKL